MVQILKKERKEKIEQAAIHEFLEKGFLNASMRKIAQRAQLSTSNLYNYFESKEELFYRITDEVYQKISTVFQDLLSMENKVGRVQFFEQVANLMANPIGEVIKNYRAEFLLIIEGSQGTKYENFQEELVKAIENHFIEHIQADKNTPTKKSSYTFIMHILAKNLIEGLLEISKHYENGEWADYNINALLKYHVIGISQFFE